MINLLSVHLDHATRAAGGSLKQRRRFPWGILLAAALGFVAAHLAGVNGPAPPRSASACASPAPDGSLRGGFNSYSLGD